MGNAHLYFLWLTASLAVVALYNLSLIGTFWGQSNVIFYYRPVDCILKLLSSSFIFFIIYLIIQLSALVMFQNWLWMVHSVGRRQTINETKNSHLYRYIFKRVIDKESKNYLYIHRYYSVCEMGKNIWLFLFNKLRSYKLDLDFNYEDQRFSNVSQATVTTTEDSQDSPFE